MALSCILDHVWQHFVQVPLLDIGLTDAEIVRFQSRLESMIVDPFPYSRYWAYALAV